MITVSIPLVLGIVMILLGVYLGLGSYAMAIMSDYWSRWKLFKNWVPFLISLLILVVGILFLTPVLDWTR